MLSYHMFVVNLYYLILWVTCIFHQPVPVIPAQASLLGRIIFHFSTVMETIILLGNTSTLLFTITSLESISRSLDYCLASERLNTPSSITSSGVTIAKLHSKDSAEAEDMMSAKNCCRFDSASRSGTLNFFLSSMIRLRSLRALST